MVLMSIPALVFFAIELIAVSNGETRLATLASGGALLCCGIYYGWRMWERFNERKDDDVR